MTELRQTEPARGKPGVQGQPLLSLRILVGATAVTTGVMLLTKAVVDTTIPRPPPKQKGPAKPKKKKSGSLRESLQVRRLLLGIMLGEAVQSCSMGQQALCSLVAAHPWS